MVKRDGVGSVVGCTLNRLRPRRLRRVLTALRQVAAEGIAADDRAMETSVVELPVLQVSINQGQRTDLCFFAGGA